MQITLLDISSLIYIFLGSTSIGYILIRTGWPTTRTLEHQYKIGSSIAAGIIFSVLTIIFAFIFSIISPQEIPFYNYIFFSMTAMFFALFILMLLKQKFVVHKTVKVSVPKEDIAAKIMAEKAVQRIIPEEQYISIRKDLSEQQLQEIKKALKEDVEQSKQEEPATEEKQNFDD
ncbi:MAG: hypothetical protein Q7S21_02150 [archaeon]|nr:hypothetical protein [archaeon]